MTDYRPIGAAVGAVVGGVGGFLYGGPAGAHAGVTAGAALGVQIASSCNSEPPAPRTSQEILVTKACDVFQKWVHVIAAASVLFTVGTMNNWNVEYYNLHCTSFVQNVPRTSSSIISAASTALYTAIAWEIGSNVMLLLRENRA